MFSFFNKKKDPIKLWFNTDIHAHLVPGVDDGSPDVETSLQLIEQLENQGIGRILSSPHIARDTFENTPEILHAAEKELTDAYTGPVELGFHAEHRIDDLLKENMEAGRLQPMPNNYLLIENSFIMEPWDLDEIIFQLQVHGFKTIMAHPERYLYYHKKKRYEELHMVCEFQVNVLSLAGYYGKTIKKVAEDLIDAGFVDYLGTDTHGVRHTSCLEEYLSSKDALRHRDALASRILNDKNFS